MRRLSLLATGILVFGVACGRKTQETKPVRKDVQETVFASGVLEAGQTYSLTARADGYLVGVSFAENDLVQPGQVLAVVDNRENIINTRKAEALYAISQRNTSPSAPLLAQAENAVQTARQRLTFDSLQAGRYQKLLATNSVSRTEYENNLLRYQNARTDYQDALDNYERTRQQVEQELINNRALKNISSVLAGYNQIRAVTPGRVYRKFKQVGDFVQKGEVIATIGDADFLYARVNVDESSIQKVKVGQSAVVQLNTDKRKTYAGKVAEILPAFDEESQSFICRIHFTEPLDFRVINTQLQANIVTGVQKNALLIPRNYLGYGNVVRVKDNPQPVKVKTRLVSSEWVQIESGIDENTVLVTENLTQP